MDKETDTPSSSSQGCLISTKNMTKKNPRVFVDVSIDGSPVERMIFELFSDVAPYTAENFRALCTGEKGISPRTGRPLHYKGSFFHHIVKGSMAQGGDFYKRDGTYGESIYGEKFPDELPSKLKHDDRGLLSMAIADRETRGSLFTITFKPLHHLDRKNIVFGKLVKGHEVLKKIENARDGDEWTPAVTVKIISCGEYSEAKKESHKSKNSKEASLEDNSLESRKRGKNKKTSRDRRKKRRKYYSSEPESSSDSETESSESESDSDSDSSISSSSSSDFSSSSDDRRKKRKRSRRRNKYKRGKRRDKRRDRKRRRRDKRAKHKSKSSESGSSEDNGVADINGKGEHHKYPAQINEAGLESFASREAVASVRNQDREDVEKEEGEYPRENGEQLNNGVKLKTRADGSAYRPDVLDDLPGKSRSRSITPKRATSKSVSISPRRSLSRSLSPRRSPSPNVANVPGVRPKTRSVSQSPAGSGSISPVRRVGTSPVRGKIGRSASRSPTISPPPTRRSLSQTPPRSSSRKSSRKSVSTSPIRVARRSISRSPIRSAGRSISRSPVRSSLRSATRSPVRVVIRSVSRSAVRSSRRSVSRSPIRSSRRSVSRSPVRSSRKSVSRSSGRAPSRRSISQSPVRGPTRNNNLRSRSRSPVGSPGSLRERSLSRSRSPDGSPKRIRRGRGFSDRYSYARRYRSPTPDRSPVRSYRYSRSDRDRYSRRSPPRRYRSPPRRRSPPRYRSRRSRTRTPVSRSPVRYRGRRYSRSPVRSPSPVAARVERRRSLSHSSASRSSRDSLPLKRATYVSRSKSLSRSSSGSPPAKKGLVSYDDGTPDSGER